MMNVALARSILGVTADSSKEEIKKAYRRAARIHHPDKGGDEEKFKQAKEAFEYLEQCGNKSNSRYEHDRYSSFGSGDDFFQEILRKSANSKFDGWAHIFGDYVNPKHKKVDDDSYSRKLKILVSLEEAFNGKTIKTQVFGKSRNVEIPPGIRNGSVIRIFDEEMDSEGYCEVLVEIALPKNTSVICDLSKNTHNSNHLGNIIVEKEISVFKMITGTTIQYNTIDGAVFDIRVPPGIQAGQSLKIAGRGYWRTPQCKSRGDVLIKIKPAIKSVKELLEHDKQELNEFIEEVNAQMQNNGI